MISTFRWAMQSGFMKQFPGRVCKSSPERNTGWRGTWRQPLGNQYLTSSLKPIVQITL
jgi:hypothetical protein